VTNERRMNKDLDTTGTNRTNMRPLLVARKIDESLIEEIQLGQKNRQAPGGERLPSHQKSHQTLGGVRLLTGLPLTYT
jgi:hypothetical protein